MVSPYVDDLDLAGVESFVNMITERVSAVLDVSKVEDDKFRYTGIDIKKVKNWNWMNMRRVWKRLR